MKKFLLFSLTALFAFSCTREAVKPTVEIDPETLTFTSVGGTMAVSVTASDDWTVETDGGDWYSVSPMSGNGNSEITVTVSGYTDAIDRTATVRIIAENTAGTATATLTLIQQRMTPPGQPETESLKVRARGGEIIVAAPQGYPYSINVPSDITWIASGNQDEDGFTLVFGENTSGQDRTAVLEVVNSEGELLMSVDVLQSWSNLFPGEFVIEEIFFTGNLLEGSTSTNSGEQYIKIANNTDEVLYADGIMVMEAKINSSTNNTYNPDIRSEYCGVQAIYVVPGSGTDVPVQPRGSILIANNAQNFKADNPGSFDLTIADFEWYDESASSANLDIDNPDVPNMDKWFCYSMSYWTMHNRGFCGYCIALPPSGMDMETYLADYRWEGTYIMHTQAGDFEMDITNAYLVPNSWVLDAVNLSVEEVFYMLSFDTSLDAGYAHCGTTDFDPERYGKSVRRKTDTDGYFVDTNNSASDFISDAVPSLAE
ncbi:MAG: DUF4876 domain-containing protein [Bacteroidetes bacterium]|uniref:DUF4876 domain-containing protein n=1 Tax=Candidatus Merdivivens pullistercoris TaxID=2840873 RepID=A0A9D9N8Q0_9BACT|nr:DUF4876 domain-containing protein [Candidatus Merdivivens pullistercoris]